MTNYSPLWPTQYNFTLPADTDPPDFPVIIAAYPNGPSGGLFDIQWPSKTVSGAVLKSLKEGAIAWRFIPTSPPYNDPWPGAGGRDVFENWNVLKIALTNANIGQITRGHKLDGIPAAPQGIAIKAACRS